MHYMHKNMCVCLKAMLVHLVLKAAAVSYDLGLKLYNLNTIR